MISEADSQVELGQPTKLLLNNHVPSPPPLLHEIPCGGLPPLLKPKKFIRINRLKHRRSLIRLRLLLKISH